ncbi:uncharacterized protein TrAFT101_008425 [Trichoderma asperellum]|uniref:Uncharacterized protein n=1 Tax=Trichoderma asperellum (strain ATCC 204424 / CBS 433.97 / NBRC 101777) TaxID=1042311 RepID=A0A2T3ZCF5_TRIA4|nr:hypothetical protein M441DRAFT_390864 [Trichoderma asperellum CBS 433.97]PTB42483.1 hypothetical protein M441DRAFT_390864 [Trichoderma asperellum CBS 433.97]UKZ93511.1 hypothetical protein TrAFT101_008425 [Trichoderma asperellum]
MQLVEENVSSLTFVVGAEGLTLTIGDGNAALHLALPKHDADMVEYIQEDDFQKWVNRPGATKNIALHLALEFF